MGFLDNVVLSEIGITEADKAQLVTASQDLPHIMANIKSIEAIIQATAPRLSRVLNACDMIAQRIATKGTTL